MQATDTAFEEKAEFLRRNVADFSGTPGLACIEGPDAASVIEGLGQYRELLLAIYANAGLFRAGTDLESYHNMTYTATFFLYAAMTAGKLCWEGVNSYLFLDKSEFWKQYRKNSVFPFEALEYFGVFFIYRRQMQPSASYSKCDSFEIHFECGNCIALALNYLSTRLRPVDPRKDYVMSAMDLVALADYESILTDKLMDRGSIDPLDGRLMRTAGDKGGLWAGLMTALAEGRRLQPSCSMFSYTPAWLIRLSRRSECAAIFTLAADRILIEINMKYEELTRLAQAKDGLPVELCRLLGALGCIGCGRCQEAGAALETVNGVRVCPLEAYARRLAFPVNGEKDVECALFLTGWKLNTSFLPPSML